MQTVYVPVKGEIPNNYFTVRHPLTKDFKEFVTEQQSVLLTKEDALKIKASIEHLNAVLDNMWNSGFSNRLPDNLVKVINKYQKEQNEALTILNKNL